MSTTYRPTYRPPTPVATVRYRVRWDRIVMATAVGLLAVALIVMAWLVAGEASTPDTPPALTACVTEDSDYCYWDGAVHGDGTGASFVTINDQTWILP